MTGSVVITDFLNGSIQAATTVIPLSNTLGIPVRVTVPILQPEMGVLIGVTGAVQGSLILEGKASTFGFLGKTMFGFDLESEMLRSFVGEFGNMIAGNMSTFLSQRNLFVDITPPVVMDKETSLAGYSETLRVPIDIQEAGAINMILLLK
ncbi:chemotaxis protein CheX [Brevibacillus massiliensis]|jgi:chemotaxis protein CheX|uniref:chemotaxis protein CheX n=1 Tax=Brevibacillus massiliensis TaxID=1118054 RepID=UPI0002EBF279|nr:chemotaxis protein CheX [Brevibacillus massiliensis]